MELCEYTIRDSSDGERMPMNNSQHLGWTLPLFHEVQVGRDVQQHLHKVTQVWKLNQPLLLEALSPPVPPDNSSRIS